MGRTDGVTRWGLTWAAIIGTSLSVPAMAQVPTAEQREHAAALGAHHICSGVFVVGRDYRRPPDEVLARDLARFRPFLWQEDFAYTVDRDADVVTVTTCVSLSTVYAKSSCHRNSRKRARSRASTSAGER